MSAAPRLEQWERGWRVYCPDCPWNSRTLPFPDPDAALHGLSLHAVLCRPGTHESAPPDPKV